MGVSFGVFERIQINLVIGGKLSQCSYMWEVENIARGDLGIRILSNYLLKFKRIRTCDCEIPFIRFTWPNKN